MARLFLFTLLGFSLTCAAANDLYDNPALKAYCRDLLAAYEAESLLEVGGILLHNDRLVLVTSGTYLSEGRISNFWYWTPLNDLGKSDRVIVRLNKFVYDVTEADNVRPGIYHFFKKPILLVSRGYTDWNLDSYTLAFRRVLPDGTLGPLEREWDVKLNTMKRHLHRLSNFEVRLENH